MGESATLSAGEGHGGQPEMVHGKMTMVANRQAGIANAHVLPFF